MNSSIKIVIPGIIVQFLFAAVFISKTGAQDLKPVTGLFDSDELIKITIRSDFDYILSYREEDREYKKAEIVYEDENGFHEIDLRVESRGNYRRDSGNCDFPPLRLNFKKKDIENTIFDGQEKIKVVSHCKGAFPEFIQYIFREYQIYKIYNQITDYSFKVRMAKILYQDLTGNFPPITKYGFLIEDEDALAKRNRMDKIDDKIQLEDLESHNAITLAIFEFMIGNTDWIVSFKKNLEIIGYGDEIVAIPYDFDYTNAVNIDFVKYGSTFPLTPLPREYKGLCYNQDTFEMAFAEFLDLRRSMLKSIRKSPYLDKDSKYHMTQYFDEFFTIIKSKSKRQEYFYNKCSNE